MAKYSFLEPLKVGKMTLKNRIILTPMARHLATDDGFVTDEFCAHFERIAKGGTALILPGIAAVDHTWPSVSNRQLWLDDDKFIPGMTRFVSVIHNAGAKVGFQLWCSGRVSTTVNVADLSLEEIARLQDLYVSAARRCKQAGADCVEFHLAHTYMPNQFLSPAFNKRTDKYGADTIENGMRFSLEIIERMRNELCTDDSCFEITAKINGTDFVTDGVTPERCADACVLLEKAGVSMITVNAGGVLQGTIVGMSDNGRQPEGWKVYLAETVKRSVSIPVAACGSIRHPEYVDSIIHEGKCDAVAMARGLFAEPNWVNLASSGRESEMRFCLSCMYCFNTVKKGESGCSMNPYAKRELEYKELIRDGNGRRIAVIGAGPAGLEAAFNLAERGFAVTIFETNDTIGGLVNLASLPLGRYKIHWLIEYYQEQIDRLNIDVVTGRAPSVEDLKALDPYAIIAAMGSLETVPPIPGIDCSCVVRVRDVLNNSNNLPSGKQVVVLGGGITGLEAAKLLQDHNNTVTVIEMISATAPKTVQTTVAFKEALAAGVNIRMGHRVTQILPDKVCAVDICNDSTSEFASDTVVLSLGIRPNNSFCSDLEDNFKRVIRVGDCNANGNIPLAVQAGCDIGRSLT